MTKQFQIYRCEVCGNITEVLHSEKGELVCCGKPMVLQKEKTEDEGKEKHVPVIKENEEGVDVNVGGVDHPMLPEHYIEWIEISTENGESKKFLKPGEKPNAKFPVKNKSVKSRAYCNVHGLWTSE